MKSILHRITIYTTKYYRYDLIGLEGLMPSMSACGYPISTLRYPTLTLTPLPPGGGRGVWGVKNRHGSQISEILGAEFIFTIENVIWVRGPPLPPPGGGGLLSILLCKYYIYDLIGLEGLMPSSIR